MLHEDGFVHQVAEIISDVREPITEVSQVVDENQSRRQQVQVGNTRMKQLHCSDIFCLEQILQILVTSKMMD